MEKLTIGRDGRLIIPSEIIKKRGLRPGDELELVESADGLLVYTGGVDQQTLSWWMGLSECERLEAAAEARRYRDLTDEGQDRLWSERADAQEPEEDDDDPDAPTR